MKLALALVALAAASSTAAAEERSMYVNLAGTIGIGSPETTPVGGEPDSEGTLMARVVASWERAPLPFQDGDRANRDVSAAPEIMLGVVRVADHRNGDVDDNADLFIAAGGRVDVRWATRGMRGGVYAGARLGLLADKHTTPLLEGTIGEYLHAGKNVRWGVELGLMNIFGELDDGGLVFEDGVMARAPWLDGSGSYLSVHATVFVGFVL